MKQRLLIIAPIVFMASMISCTSKIEAPVTPPPPNGVIDGSDTYTVSGTRIIMCSVSDSNIRSYCNGIILVHDTETTGGDCHTSEFLLSGNTLTFYLDPDTMDTSGSIVKRYHSYVRRGSGSGLMGVWTFSTFAYTVLSGTLTTDERAELDANAEGNINYMTIDGAELEITADKINYYETYRPAAQFYYEWNESFSSSGTYDITITKVDDFTISMLGRKNGETVTLTWNSSHDKTYIGSNTAYFAYTNYSDPTSCPNEREPLWYSTFLDDNRMGIPKMAVSRSQRFGDIRIPGGSRTATYVVE